VTPTLIAAITTMITASVGAIAVLRKLRPERETLVLTTAQGATTILNDLVKTLYVEIERLREREEELEAELEACREGSPHG
jgi:hypothetical protein